VRAVRVGEVDRVEVESPERRLDAVGQVVRGEGLERDGLDRLLDAPGSPLT
jgi:hypothetical protein